jgi:hypothetical protein
MQRTCLTLTGSQAKPKRQHRCHGLMRGGKAQDAKPCAWVKFNTQKAASDRSSIILIHHVSCR